MICVIQYNSIWYNMNMIVRYVLNLGGCQPSRAVATAGGGLCLQIFQRRFLPQTFKSEVVRTLLGKAAIKTNIRSHQGSFILIFSDNSSTAEVPTYPCPTSNPTTNKLSSSNSPTSLSKACEVSMVQHSGLPFDWKPGHDRT